MNDIFILKAAHHMHNRVAFPDVGQELIAQPLALAGALHQTRNIHKLNGGGGHFFRVIHIGQHVQPLIRHRHDAGVGFNGAERIIRRLGSRPGDGVEQRALSHVRQSYDPKFHIVPLLLSKSMVLQHLV